jgi:hypothetical protein
MVAVEERPSLGTIFLPAGDYDIQMLNWEGGGGANVELYASPGIQDLPSTSPPPLILCWWRSDRGSTGKNKVLGVAQWQLKGKTTGVANVTDVITAGRGLGGPGVQRGTDDGIVPTNSLQKRPHAGC